MAKLFLLINLLLASNSSAYAEAGQVRGKGLALVSPKLNLRRFGIGGTLGITGYRDFHGGFISASGKYWLSDIAAFAGEIDFPLFGEFGVNADYLFHFGSGHADSGIIPYIGIGILIYHSTDVEINTHSSLSNGSSTGIVSSSLNSWKIGFRVPMGIEFPVVNKDLKMFVQLVHGVRNNPYASYTNGSSFNVGYGVRFDLGARYYF
ncbi:MAG: hypothetical protein ABIQ95_00205 [Bdellovibrionia bacterium]